MSRKLSKYIERTDVSREGWAPAEYRVSIRRIAGTNPYDEPLYRIVLAEHVYTWHGGEHWDWPEDADLQSQGGLVFSDEIVQRTHVIQPPPDQIDLPPQVITYEGPAGLVPSTCKPIRRVVESRWVQRYPEMEGWIIQRWRPASHFGNREVWEQMVYPGTSIGMLGPFPEKGDYEFAREYATPEGTARQSFAEIPPLSLVEEFVQFDMQQRLELQAGSRPDIRVKLRQEEYESRLKKMREAQREERRKEILDFIRPIMGSSLESGRIRNALAKQAGIQSHVGN